MFRIVEGMGFVGKPSKDRWLVSLLDLGNGHKEATIRQAIDWTEAEFDPRRHADWLADQSEAQREADAEERRQANAVRAARRAKTRVRRLCKAQGLDTMLTLTYKANQTDLALCKRHFVLFAKRLARALGSFCYVAAFEQQKRGAWHVHIACHRLPPTLAASNGVKVKSFNVVRAIWRSVTGELGGNIDQARRKRTSAKSAASVAGYLSKYLLKAFEAGQDYANRYQASRVEVPRAVTLQFRTESLRDLIELVFGEVADSARLCSAFVSKFGDMVYLAAEPPGI